LSTSWTASKRWRAPARSLRCRPAMGFRARPRSRTSWGRCVSSRSRRSWIVSWLC
jgi:hypothetical protein